MRRRLKDFLPSGKAKTPGFGISQGFYYTVLADAPTLPPLLTVINPKGDGGAVEGFALPWSRNQDKAHVAQVLSQPMIRGTYLLTSPDRKTALMMKVLSKEEAGFDPSFLVTSPLGKTLEKGVRDRILATWNILQLTFESHDPMVYPALDFLTSVSDRLADLCEGVVADPISQVYRLPGQFAVGHDPGQKFATLNHVQAKQRILPEGSHVHTLGLQKFGLPELEMTGVDSTCAEYGAQVLLGLSQKLLAGVKIAPGDRAGGGGILRVADGGLDRAHWGQTPVLEIIPERGSINDILQMMEQETNR